MVIRTRAAVMMVPMRCVLLGEFGRAPKRLAPRHDRHTLIATPDARSTRHTQPHQPHPSHRHSDLTSCHWRSFLAHDNARMTIRHAKS